MLISEEQEAEMKIRLNAVAHLCESRAKVGHPPPSAAPYLLNVGSTALTLSGTLYYNPAFWQNASDFIGGLMPGPAPASYAGAAGELVGRYWDDIW